MKIQFASDLHLEFPENRELLKSKPLEKSGDILILAGDIVSDRKRKKAKEIFESWYNNYELIISTMGNHEFYKGTIDYAQPKYKKQVSENHIHLNNYSIAHKGIKFIVSTLWSFVPDQFSQMIEENINDYKLIKLKSSCDIVPITYRDTNIYHKYSVKFLEKELSEPFEGTVIVITHHLPSDQCIDKKWTNSDFKYAYSTDLDYLFYNYKIDYWIFGHQHETIDMKINKTRLLSNPLGYFDEDQIYSFQNNYCFTL